jgi:hypothetical protein
MSTDMNSYRFISDTEPTEQQLLTIMKEVEADVRRENLELKQQINLKLRQEYKTASAKYQTLQ